MEVSKTLKGGNDQDYIQFTSTENFDYASLSLFSIWCSKRINCYETKKERPTEPNILYCFFHTLEGTGKIVTTNGTFFVEQDSLILLDVNTIIKYLPTTKSWTYYCYNFTTTSPIPYFKFNKVYNVPFDYLEKNICNEISGIMQHYSKYSILLSNVIFLKQMYSWITHCVKVKKEKSIHYSEISAVIVYINNNLDKKLTIADLSKQSFLSERQFRSIFKKETGLSPSQFICQQKLRRIAYLLRTTSYTVTALSEMFNYSSPFLLSREFKKLFNQSPRQYRQNISTQKDS